MIAKMKANSFSCSFCGRSKGEVANIVSGTPQRASGVPQRMIGKSAFICNECVEHYRQLMSPELSRNSAAITK